MRTKTLLATAVLSAAGVATSMAQVFSVNAVGYINVDVPPGFSMIANQLNAANNAISALIPTAPGGTAIYKFTGSAYEIYTFDDLDSVWLPNGNATLNPGEGAFIRNPTQQPFRVTFVGEVPTGSLSNPLPAGFSIRSSQVPQAGGITSDLGFPAAGGDTIYQFNNAGNNYTISTFDDLDSVWLPTEPEIDVGEAFFVRKTAAGDWTRTFDVNATTP
jgi:hypothetical protein